MNRLSAVGATAGAFVATGLAAKLLDDRRRAGRRRELESAVGFGSLHSEPRTVVASDGTAINVEIDEPLREGPSTGPTLVFVHGWVCDLDSWHFQRQALRGRHRMVFMDQRSHGHSGRSNQDNSSLADLADDLRLVIEECAPGEQVVLIGHSMGGMTIMELAGEHPDLFGSSADGQGVVGVMLIGTSSGRLIGSAPGIVKLAPLLRVAGPALDQVRGINSRALMRRWAVGPGAADVYVDMTDEMIRRARTHVLLDFYPNFVTLDTTRGLKDIGRVPTVVVGGTEDLLTPFKHSRRLAEAIPGATLVAVEGAGHMVMFEAHERVTEALLGLLERI